MVNAKGKQKRVERRAADRAAKKVKKSDEQIAAQKKMQEGLDRLKRKR